MQITTDILAEVSNLVNLVNGGLESLTKAGHIVKYLIDEEGVSPQKLADLTQMMSKKDILDLYSVGAGKVASALFVMSAPAVSYLKKMPLPLQNELLENNVEVISRDNGGKICRFEIPVSKMTHKQCRTAFTNEGKIRNITAQKKQLVLQDSEKVEKPRYVIENGKLLVYKPICFTKESLKQILAQM